MKRKEVTFVGEPPQICDTADAEMQISEAFLASLKKRGLLTLSQINECKIKIMQIYTDNREK